MSHNIADCRLRVADWQRRPTAAKLGIAVAVLACAGSIALTARSIEPVPVRLLAVFAQGSAIVIEASEPVAYVVSRPDPLSIVVELREATVAEANNQVTGRDLVAGVTLEDATALDGKPVARVRVALAKPAESKVRSARNTIRIELSPTSAENYAARFVAPPVHALLPTAAASAADGSAEPVVATILDGVRSNIVGAATIVTLSGNGRLVPTQVTETQDPPRRLVFDFAGVASRAPAQTAVDSAVVRRVRIGVNRTPLTTRVVLEIADSATYHLERSDSDAHSLSVVFEPGLSAGTVKVDTPAASADVKPDVIPLRQALANGTALAPPPDVVGIDPMGALKAIGQVPPASQPGPAAASFGPQPPAGQPPDPAPPPAAPPPAAPSASRRTAAPPASQQIGSEAQKKYVGTPITLDFSGADLRTVLRVFADHSGLNILIDPGVPSTPQDFLLKEIPWDQAMEIVLRANQLGYEVDGTVIRIAPLKVLEDEQKQRTSLAAARATNELRVQTFALSYAKAEALSPLLVKATLSQYGQIQVDPRTNTLVIRDIPQNLQTTADLIATLDKPEPQVEVEARIVTTSRDFARAIGIQWGLNGRMTPEIGNTTNLAFPNRGTIGGRLGQQGAAGTDVRASPGDQAGTAVDLGVPAPNSAIGLALGAVNGAFNLDVALSALESSGKGRVLSTPRLTTQNNVLAEIAQGVEIPIQTVSNNTVTVSFKDATLKLLVTPQITAAGTVIMQVEIHNAVPDFSREVNGIPPIDTQRAITRVQVNDGETTVIGGIFVSTEQQASDRTPGLSRLPLLGWLFRRDSQLDESRELLIFLTPRIIKG